MNRYVLAALGAALLLGSDARGNEASVPQPAATSDIFDRFERIHAMVRPQTGESLWMEIPWLTSVWEARRKAAAEGKPIFIWAGNGGSPAAVC